MVFLIISMIAMMRASNVLYISGKSGDNTLTGSVELRDKNDDTLVNSNSTIYLFSDNPNKVLRNTAAFLQATNGVANFSIDALCSVSSLTVTAYAENYTEYTSSEFTVSKTDDLDQCSVNVSQSIKNGTFYAEEPLSLNIELAKDSTYLYGDVTITDISEEFKEETTTGSISTDSHSLTFTYNKSGKKRIYINLLKSSNYYISFQEFELVYRPRPLKVIISENTVFSNQPNETTTIFSITVKIFWENDLKTIYSLRDFDVSLNLSPSGEFLGKRSGRTVDGTITFTDLLIKEEGIFKIEASGSGLYPNTSESLTITNTEAVNSIILNSSTSSIKSGDFFQINFYLFNYSENLFTSQTTVTLYTHQKDFIGTNTISTRTGQGKFNVSLSSIGPVTFKAYTQNDTKVPKVTSLKITVLDKLCKDLNSDKTCLKCESLSDFNEEGLCECKEKAYEKNKKCFCYDGFAVSDQSCVECGNYVLTKDVRGRLKENLKGFEIRFAFQVNSSLFDDCLKVLVLPEELHGVSFQCTWLGDFAFEVKTEKLMENKDFFVGLKRDLAPVEKVCVVFKEARVNVLALNSRNWPDIKLIAPETYSISCSLMNLQMFVSPVKEEYEFKWTLFMNSKLFRSITGQTSVSLEKNLLKQGSLGVKVNISSPLSSKTVELSTTVILTTEQILDLQLNRPFYSKVKKSENLFIKASTFDTCSSSNGVFNYSWKYVSSTKLDISRIIFPTTADSIIIPPNTLQVSEVYIFQVTVSKEGSSIEGVKNFTLEVEPTDIQIAFDSWGGVFKTGKKMMVQATAFDPDEPEANLDYKWTCSQGTRICRDNGEEIIESENSSLLSVNSSHLKQGKSYLFTLTVQKGLKKSEKSLEFLINKNFQADLLIPSIKTIQRRSWPLTVIPNISTSSFFTFRWSFTPPLSDPWSYENNKLFMFLPKNQLTPGVTYKLTLFLKDSHQEKFSFSTFVECPSAPQCGLFDVKEDGDQWVLSIKNCFSSHGFLTYQFGVVYNLTVFDKMTLKITSAETRLELKEDVEKVFVEVCDSFNCQNFLAIVKARRRGLNELEDAENMIKNPEDVLRAIYLYGDYLNSTQFTFLYEKFLMFFKSVQFDEATFYLYLEKMNVVLRRSDSINKYVFRDIIDVFVQEYKDKQYSLSRLQMTTLLNSIDAYVIQNSTLYNLRLLTLISQIYLNTTFPSSSPIIYSKGYFIYIQRLTGDELSGLTLGFPGWRIKMPVNKTIDLTKIYDLVIIKLNSSEEVISIKVFQVGYLSDYNLVFTESLEDDLNATSPGTIVMNYGIDSDYHYKCKVLNENTEKWKNDGCSLLSLESDLTETEFDGICTVKIAKVSKKCPFNFYPIVALGVIVFGFGGIFFLVNRNDQATKGFLKPKNYLTIHPIISLLFVQKYRVRANLIAQMFTNTILLFAMIGFLHNYFAYPLKASYEKYEKFLDYHAEIGAIGFAGCQIYILPCFFLNSFLPINNKYFMIMNIIRLLVLLPSISGIIAMSIIYCGQFTFRWLINFVIFLPAQVFFLEAIYSFFIEICIGEDQSRFKRVSTLKFPNAGESDDFDSSDPRQQQGYLFKVFKMNKVSPQMNN